MMKGKTKAIRGLWKWSRVSGQKPEGVPVDVDDMVRTQVAPVREVIYAQKMYGLWNLTDLNPVNSNLTLLQT